MTNKYKHSGAMGDLIYSLSIVNQLGGGEFYLHMNQLDWIGQHYYGAKPDPFHQGRLNDQDFEFMKPFMQQLPYISQFGQLNPKTHEITHNLDRFRLDFVKHPTNYLNLYAQYHNIDPNLINNKPWLSVQQPKKIPSRTVAVNRSSRWHPESADHWQELKDQNIEQEAFFLGLESEYRDFINQTGWNIPWQPTTNMLELAEYIAGAEIFVGNQSQCYALAVGLGVPEIHLEIRRDLPLERNECYFPTMSNIVGYF